jgi:hypothetical protein
MAVRLRGCQRCQGTLVACEDGWSCLSCGKVVYQRQPVTHAGYHVGTCEVCGANGWVFRHYVGDRLLWVCSRCDGVLGRRARRATVVDKQSVSAYTICERQVHYA